MNLTDTLARISLDINAPGHELVISGGARREEGTTRLVGGEVIKALNSPTGMIEVPVPHTDDFRQEDGSYTFTLGIRRTGKAPGKPKAPPRPGPSTLNRMRWSLRNVAVSLEGTSR